MRRAAKQDSNQSEIVDRLRQCSVSVEIIGKPLDLLICHRGETSLMEVKNPDGKDFLTKAQVEFIARWPGKIHIVHSVQDALEAVLRGGGFGMIVTYDEQIACIERELAMRGRVYPRWVAQGKLTQSAADLEINRMRAVHETLKRVKQENAQ